MAATVHVVSRFVARSGKEAALQSALQKLIQPTRRHLGCYQYDTLVNTADPREFCCIERWDGDRPLDEHLAEPDVRTILGEIEGLVEAPPEIRRYRIV